MKDDQYEVQLLDLLRKAKEQAYAKGWADAVRRIVNTAMEDAGTAALKTVLPPTASRPEQQVTAPGRPTITVVYEIVSEHPGLRGFEIIKELLQRQPTMTAKVADRTGRTGLARLKERGKITQRDGRWYPLEILQDSAGDEL